MEVYIEYVILDNFVITWWICALSHSLTRTRGRLWRDLLAAVLGTAVAVGYPFIRSVWWTIAVKIGLCAVLALICYPPRRFVGGVLGILATTFLFGGLAFAAGFMRYGNVNAALTLPLADFPIGLPLAALGVLFLCGKRLLIRRHRAADGAGAVFRMAVEYNGRKAVCSAFCDSGNRLYDYRSGLPVIVLGARAGCKLLSDDEMTAVLLGRAVRGGHYQTFSTAAGRGKILIVHPSKITLYVSDKPNIVDNVVIGLSFARLHGAEGYDAILPLTSFSREKEVSKKKRSKY